MAKQSEAMEILFHEVSSSVNGSTRKLFRVEREIHRSKFSLTSSFKKFSFSIK